MRISVFLFVLFYAFSGWAQGKAAPAKAKKPTNPNQALRAIVVAEQAYIFTQPDFDAEVMTILSPSKTIYIVSKGKWGPFHKIRLAPGKLGFVLDSDIRFVKAVKTKKGKEVFKVADPKPKPDEAKKPEEKRSFYETRYIGPAAQMTNYTEDTMASLRTESLTMVGLKYSGLNGFFDNMTYTDSNFLVYWGAPGYYSEATGNSAEGWILIADMLMEATQMQTPNVMSFFGIGPMFRYSHINAVLNEGGIRTEYSLDDMVLGAVFNVGVAARIGSYAVRLDGKYYWEKQKYWALGLAFQFDL